jgi:hypothetical protein
MSPSVLFHPAVVAWFERSFRAPTVDVIRCILECVASDFRFERREDPDRKANQAGISGLFAGGCALAFPRDQLVLVPEAAAVDHARLGEVGRLSAIE